MLSKKTYLMHWVEIVLEAGMTDMVGGRCSQPRSVFDSLCDLGADHLISLHLSCSQLVDSLGSKFWWRAPRTLLWFSYKHSRNFWSHLRIVLFLFCGGVCGGAHAPQVQKWRSEDHLSVLFHCVDLWSSGTGSSGSVSGTNYPLNHLTSPDLEVLFLAYNWLINWIMNLL